MVANILIATPQVEFGELLRLNIEESGEYNITVVKSGSEVMQKANEIEFNLAILDPALADQPFAPLAQNLIDKIPNLRLVVIQSQNTANDQAIQNLTIHAFLSRPFYPPDMIEMIQNLLNAPVVYSEENISQAVSELSEIEPSPPDAEAELEPLEETSPEPAPPIIEISNVIENSTLDELARELDNLNQGDKPAGQDDIDKLFAQFSENSPPNEHPLPPESKLDTDGILAESQPLPDLEPQESAPVEVMISLPEVIAPLIDEPEGQENIEKLLADLKATGFEEDSTPPQSEKFANLLESEAEKNPLSLSIPPLGDENLFIEDSELATKHSDLASKYAALANEYSSLATEHLEMATKHAELATDKAVKDREKLEILKALNPVIEKVKQLLADTSAQAALVARSGKITAVAGDLNSKTIQEVAAALSENWDNDNKGDLVRFIRLTGFANEAMLYASAIRDDYILGLIYDNATPLSRMRTQALQMARLLSSQRLDMVYLPGFSADGEPIDSDLGQINSAQPDEEIEPNEWVPENPQAQDDEDRATSILKDVFAQLEVKAQLDESSDVGTELTLEEELNHLFARGAKPTLVSFDINKGIGDISQPEEASEIISEQPDIVIPIEETPESISEKPDDVIPMEEVDRQKGSGADLIILDMLNQLDPQPVEVDPQFEQGLVEENDFSEIPHDGSPTGESHPLPIQETDLGDLIHEDKFDPPNASFLLDDDTFQTEGASTTTSFNNFPEHSELPEMNPNAILADVLDQLKSQSELSSSSALESEEPGTSEEELPQILFEKAYDVAEFNFSSPADRLPPTEAENILDHVRAQLDQQAFPAITDENNQAISPQSFSLEEELQLSSSDLMPVVPDSAGTQPDPILPGLENERSQDPAYIFHEIIDRLEASTAGSEHADDEFLYPWDYEPPNDTKKSPTQPVRVSPTSSQTDIPTSPIRIGAAIDLVKSEMENLEIGQLDSPFHADKNNSEFNADLYGEARDNPASDSTESIQMKYNGDFEYPQDSQSAFDEYHKPALGRRFSVSQLLNNVAYTCVLVPRLPEVLITGELAHYLGEQLPQICLVFGWHLEKVDFQPDYMQWTVQMLPAVSPGHLVRVIRQRTSKHIYQQFPFMKEPNISDDFWAPGYLITSGSEPPGKKAMDDFIQQTRRRQRLLKNLSS